MAEIYETYPLEQLKNIYNQKVPFYRKDFRKEWTRKELIRILNYLASQEASEDTPAEEFLEDQSEEVPTISEAVSVEEEAVPIKKETLSNTITKPKEEFPMKSQKSASPFRKIVGRPDENQYRPTTSITYQEFQKELRNPSFIQSFNNSILQLTRYKIGFYKKKLKETEEEENRIKQKVAELKRNGVADNDIHQMYPMKRFYVGMIINFKEIIEKLEEKLIYAETGGWNVQKNLMDAIENEKDGLLSISGRENIKNTIASQLYAFGQNYKIFTESFNNICLLGGAGTGKTRLAKVISYVYNKSGLLAFNYAKIVSRVDLVAGNIGETAPKTLAVLMETLEGILFIDEAYQLGLSEGDTSRDFGPESITEIVNFLDKFIGMNIVIVAGYENQMVNRFFATNEGLERRFPFRLVLQNYTAEELCSILIGNIEEKLEKKLDEETIKYICTLVTFMYNQDQELVKYQAGDMLNLGTSIVQSINSSYKRKWKDGDLDNNMPILKDGFNGYLKAKNYILE